MNLMSLTAIQLVEKLVCEDREIQPSTLHTRKKHRIIAETRHVIIVIAIEVCRYNTTQASGYFGLRHSDAVYAKNAISNLVRFNKAFAFDFARYKEIVEKQLELRSIETGMDVEVYVLEKMHIRLTAMEKKIRQLESLLKYEETNSKAPSLAAAPDRTEQDCNEAERPVLSHKQVDENEPVVPAEQPPMRPMQRDGFGGAFRGYRPHNTEECVQRSVGSEQLGAAV